MKLVVGLGNIGKEYKNTRHNTGFKIIDEYLGKVDWKAKMEAYIYKTNINDEEVVFVKPMTYMNLSGIAVSKVVKYYKINMEDILVIQDDLDLPIATYKVKKNSSSGGHNGIKSIISELNSEAFGRLKVGIASLNDKAINVPVDRYVLAKFTKAEEEELDKNMDQYKRIIDLFINKGIDYTISTYNQN